MPISNKKPSCPKTGKAKIKMKITGNNFFIIKGFYKVTENIERQRIFIGKIRVLTVLNSEKNRKFAPNIYNHA